MSSEVDDIGDDGCVMSSEVETLVMMVMLCPQR